MSKEREKKAPTEKYKNREEMKTSPKRKAKLYDEEDILHGSTPLTEGCFSGLNQQQSNFVRNFLVTGNARGAARDAGYEHQNSGSVLMKNPNVLAVIREEQMKRATRLDINADRVLQELAAIAFSNIADVMEWRNGGIKIKDSRALNRMITAAVSEVSETVTGRSTTTKIKMHDKLGALDKLARHLGLYNGSEDPNKANNPLDALKQIVELSVALRDKNQAAINHGQAAKAQFEGDGPLES